MKLDDRVHSLYRLARYALLQFELYVPACRVSLTAIPKTVYEKWVDIRDEAGKTKMEVEIVRENKKQKEKAGLKELGLCEIVGKGEFNIRIAYPDERDEYGLWDAHVFRYLCHELSHVWWFMQTDLGKEERVKIEQYNEARKSLNESLVRMAIGLPEIEVPAKLSTYTSYQDFAIRYLQRMEYHNRKWLDGVADNDYEAYKKMMLCSQLRTDLDRAARKLAETSRALPTVQAELREGWAEYVSMHALEWFYKQNYIESLEPLPEGVGEYGKSLQQMELWKRKALAPYRLDMFTGLKKVNNGAYTRGLERFNKIRSFKEAREFVMKARSDNQLPLL